MCFLDKQIGDQVERWDYASPMTKKSLNDLAEWGSEDQKKDLRALLDAVQTFEFYGNSWLTIVGRPGVGKTHAVQWIAQQLEPWAVYISATEFEAKVYDSMDEDGLSDFKKAMKDTPILVYDDAGANYNSKFGLAALAEIIDYRWNLGRERLTVTTTNMSRTAIESINPRIADRLFDATLANVLEMKHALSWRTAHVVKD